MSSRTTRESIVVLFCVVLCCVNVVVLFSPFFFASLDILDHWTTVKVGFLVKARHARIAF